MDGSGFIPQQAERSDAWDRIRANRALAFAEFKKIKARMRDSNSWEHYEFCSNFLLIKAAEHRALTRILIKNGVN